MWMGILIGEGLCGEDLESLIFRASHGELSA